jgi:hypothetical protein
MNKLIFAALALAASAIAAHATVPVGQWDGEWFHMDGGSRFDVYIMRATQNSDGTLSYWMRLEYKKAKIIAGNAIVGIKDHTDINCATGMIRNTMEVQYDAEGNPVRTFNEPEAWSLIVPESLASIAQTLLCKKGAQ